MRLTLLAVLGIGAVPHVLGKVPRFGRLYADGEYPLPTQTYEMPIDHFGGSVNGTFQNRWWYNDTFLKPGGPVFLYDAGELDASASIDFLLEPNGTKTVVMQLAQRYHGLAILWEHRYYGQSFPFGAPSTSQDLDWTYNATQLSFLTVEQALEDVVTFANNFTLPADASAAGRLNGSDSLRPNKTPWVFIGGSYPGTRAAIMRVRNPDVIYASWASSAVVQTIVDGYGYFDQVKKALPTNCSLDIIAAVQYADNAFSSSNATLSLAVQRKVVGSGDPNPESAAFMMQQPFEEFQSAGLASVLPLCDDIETQSGVSSPSDAGVAASAGAAVAFDRYAAALQRWLNTTQLQVLSNLTHDQPLAISSASEEPGWALQGVMWEYQVCTEIGAYQVANPDASQSIVSKLVSVNQTQQRCNTNYPGVPSSPAVDHINKYGGWNMTPSRTFFSSGEYDPWRSFGVASTEPGAPVRQATTIVPPAGFSFSNGSYYGVVYPGQVHVSDFYSMPAQPPAKNAAFEQGLQMFTQALDVWLLAFGTANATQSGSSSTPAAGRNSASSRGAVWMWMWGVVNLCVTVVCLL